jgi:hypothetical protein
MHFCIICNSFDNFHNTVLQHFDCRFDKCWQMNYMSLYLIQSDNRNISIHSHSKWLSVILYRLNYDWQMDIHRSTVFDILIGNAMVFELNKYFFLITKHVTYDSQSVQLLHKLETNSTKLIHQNTIVFVSMDD